MSLCVCACGSLPAKRIEIILYAAERQHIVHSVSFSALHFVWRCIRCALSFILPLWLYVYILSYHFANGQHYSAHHFHSDNVKINALNIFVVFVLRVIRDYNYTGHPSHYNCLHAKNVLSIVSEKLLRPS